MLTPLRTSRSIAAQLILLVAASALIFHVCIGLAVYAAHLGGTGPELADVDIIADVVNALDGLPSDRRAQYLEEIVVVHPGLNVDMIRSPSPTVVPVGEELATQLSPLLPRGSSLAMTTAGRLAISTPADLNLTIAFPKARLNPPPFGNIVFGTLLFVASSVTLFVLWAIRTITKPLGDFAKAVDRFALDQKNELLQENGSLEVRTASRAFNRMQKRIQTMMDDRTRMLASIGHDLRTPITRIRLRAEFITDESVRGSVIKDLDHMDWMVHGALSFLRDETARPPKASLDLASLLQTICDEFSDLGHDVIFVGPGHLTIDAYIEDLRRGVTNLVNNAVFHAENATIELRRLNPEWVEIDVVDNGPGIPDAEKSDVFVAFGQGSSALSKKSGFGLGLPIVQTIAAMHGGSISLHDRPGGGLISRLRLPGNP